MKDHNNRYSMLCFICVAIVYFLTSCATFKPEILPKPAERQEVEVLQLRPGIEPLFMRGDIDRQVACQTNYRGSQAVTTCTPVPYHFMGIFLGNGIFMDLRSNLSVVLSSLLGLDKLTSYTLTQNVKSLFGTVTLTTIREGDEIRIHSPGMFSDATLITKLIPNGIILQGDGKLVVDEKGVHAEGVPEKTFLGIKVGGPPPAIIRESPTRVDFAGTEVVMKSAAEIQFGKHLTLSHMGRAVEIKYSRGLFHSSTFRLIRAPNKLAILDKKEKKGVLFDWNDKEITITQAPGGLGSINVAKIFIKR